MLKGPPSPPLKTPDSDSQKVAGFALKVSQALALTSTQAVVALGVWFGLPTRAQLDSILARSEADRSVHE